MIEIELYPTPEQHSLLMCTAGYTRYVYNWCLDHLEECRKQHSESTILELAKRFSAAKPVWHAETIDQAAYEAFYRMFKLLSFDPSATPGFMKRKDGIWVAFDAQDVQLAKASIQICSHVDIKLKAEIPVNVGDACRYLLKHYRDVWTLHIEDSDPIFEKLRSLLTNTEAYCNITAN